ncbi:hypothetical protein BDZ89DRAFT_504001 [Hymenopellis radicata]|nr:hypothetical protein BDZ89DRAFT_504001 [Hymenopellis radicata]
MCDFTSTLTLSWEGVIVLSLPKFLPCGIYPLASLDARHNSSTGASSESNVAEPFQLDGYWTVTGRTAFNDVFTSPICRGHDHLPFLYPKCGFIARSDRKSRSSWNIFSCRTCDIAKQDKLSVHRIPIEAVYAPLESSHNVWSQQSTFLILDSFLPAPSRLQNAIWLCALSWQVNVGT